MTSRTITAIYDSAEDAQRAQAKLLSLGLGASDVRILDQGTAKAGGEKGFWESIKDFFIPDDERATYAEGMRRGGYLLTARVDDEYADEVCDVLENSGAIDLDQRVEQWRAEGWSEAAPPAPASDLARAEGATEDAIPVVREHLRVGKREVNRGGVRVRTYIVEEPVSEQVQLREERVEVERRPVGQAVKGDAGDLLQERTIEVSETAEEPIIAKEAEVTEEVVVRKFEGQRTQGVSDTVRHTEVDVEDTRDERPTPPPSTRETPTRGPGASKPRR
jgi:uncharacterized protein (TIGR02271 family)